ncbi:MAG: hypothetical protein ABW106_04370 [Steroidobacteraceae bacterium]
MSKVIVILGTATLAFGSASAYLYNDLRDTRAESASLQVRVAELEKAAQAPTPVVVQATPEIPVNPFTPPSAAPTSPSPPPIAKPAPVRGALATPVGGMVSALSSAGPVLPLGFAGGWEQSQKMLADPEYRDAMKRQQKLMMPRMYPDLQEALQIDSKQADELFDLLAEHQIRGMTDARPPFLNRESPPDEAAIRAWSEKQQQLQSVKDAEIVTLLGDAGAQQWKNYNNSMPARMQLRELRSTLESAGVPLEREQSEKLVAVIAAEQQKAMRDMQWSPRVVAAPGLATVTSSSMQVVGQSSKPSRPVDRTSFYEQQVERTKLQQQQMRAAVSPHLSSRQMEQFERQQASQLEMQEIQLKMMRAQAAAEARGDLPPSNQDMAVGSFSIAR